MPVYAFVSEISASPTILLDLDNQSPFSVVEGTKTSPPTRRVNSFGSAARDGDTISAKSYNDRTLTIELWPVENTTAEEQTEGLQKIARLLDSEQWLMWQHDGMISPLFFRVKYGDFEVNDEYMTEDDPTRFVTLVLVAEPSAYGLPVTGTATIANDPTVAAASNPMSYVFPDIQGDVATPVAMTLGGPAEISAFALAVTSSDVERRPVYVAAPTSRFASAPMVVTANSTARADAIGGQSDLWQTNGAASSASSADYTVTLPVGDYRVYARCFVNYPTGYIKMGITNLAGDSPSLNVTVGADASLWQWVDLGVTRLPVSAKYDDDLPSLVNRSSGTGLLRLELQNTEVANKAIYVDGLLFVPCGLDDSDSTTLLTGAVEGINTSTAGSYQIDAFGQQVFYGNSTNFKAGGCAGGFPQVLPGKTNTLSLVRAIETGVGGSYKANDNKTSVWSVSWMYYPHYLYTRPATT